MNIVDYIIIMLVAWSAYKGFSNGFIISVAGLLALLLGVFGAIRFSDITSSYLIEHFEFNSRHLPVISFAITFIIIVIAVHFTARVVDKLVKAVALGFVNRIAGAAFNVLKIAFILSIVLLLLNKIDDKTGIISKELKEESLFYEPLSGFAPMIFPYLDFKTVNEYIPNSIQI